MGGGIRHISYFDQTNFDLKYATNAHGNWVTTMLDPAGGYYPSLEIDGQGKVHIGYYLSGSSKKDLKYTALCP